jgi:hypothetical protein
LIPKFRSLALSIALATIAACASQGARATTSQGAATSGSRNLVSAGELATVGELNLYDALARIRPTMLQPRIGGGTTGVSAVPISIFYDGNQMREGVQSLRELAAKNIAEVRLLEPQQASARFGGNHANGALVITSKK